MKCQCANQIARMEIDGTHIDYVLVVCVRCRKNDIWFVDKETRNTYKPGTEIYTNILTHLILESKNERNNRKKEQSTSDDGMGV